MHRRRIPFGNTKMVKINKTTAKLCLTLLSLINKNIKLIFTFQMTSECEVLIFVDGKEKKKFIVQTSVCITLLVLPGWISFVDK